MLFPNLISGQGEPWEAHLDRIFCFFGPGKLALSIYFGVGEGVFRRSHYLACLVPPQIRSWLISAACSLHDVINFTSIFVSFSSSACLLLEACSGGAPPLSFWAPLIVCISFLHAAF